MVTLPALSPVDPHVHSLKIPRRPSMWICVTKTVAIWSNTLTNAVTLSKKDILGILKNLQAARGDSTAPPFGLPPLRRQHVNLRDEKPRKCDAIFGYVATLAHLGLRRTVNCVLMDVWYGALSRSVTVFPLKARFINTSAAILMYFVNTTLTFSAIIQYEKFNLKDLQ